jgi:hypothetical protein
MEAKGMKRLLCSDKSITLAIRCSDQVNSLSVSGIGWGGTGRRR